MNATSARRVLVDTSAWIEALRRGGDPAVRAEVSAATVDGAAVFCDLVLLELWNGARGTAEIEMLEQLQRDVECVPTTAEVWALAAVLARSCRRRGLTVPATDLLIAACARTHSLSLLHRDSHFDLIAEVSSERS